AGRDAAGELPEALGKRRGGGQDAGRKLRRVTGGIGGGRREDLVGAHWEAQRDAEADVAAGVGHHVDERLPGRRQREALALGGEVERVGVVGEELDAVLRVGVGLESAGDAGLAGAVLEEGRQHGGVLEVVGVVGGAVALGVVGGRAVVFGEGELVGQV